MSDDDNKALVTRDEAAALPATITRQQRELLKRTIAKGSTDDEFEMFLVQCQTRGLNPFTGQIHFVKYGDQAVIQVGIEGLRSMAEATGDYAGQEDAVFEYDRAGAVESCTKTVYRWMRDQRIPFTSTVKFSERVRTKSDGKLFHNWQKMPETMLAKCTEADALRKAFPQPLGGVYIDAEMEQADSETPRQAAAPPKPRLQRPKAEEPLPQQTDEDLESKRCGDAIQNADVRGRRLFDSRSRFQQLAQLPTDPEHTIPPFFFDEAERAQVSKADAYAVISAWINDLVREAYKSGVDQAAAAVMPPLERLRQEAGDGTRTEDR